MDEATRELFELGLVDDRDQPVSLLERIILEGVPRLRWVTNYRDPRRSAFMPRIRTIRLGSGRGFDFSHESFEQHRKWLAQFTIGRPKATPWYTREQLEDMHMIGLYLPENE